MKSGLTRANLHDLLDGSPYKSLSFLLFQVNRLIFMVRKKELISILCVDLIFHDFNNQLLIDLFNKLANCFWLKINLLNRAHAALLDPPIYRGC